MSHLHLECDGMMLPRSPYKGTIGVQRILNAARYSWAGLKTAFTQEAAFRQIVLLNLILIPSTQGIWVFLYYGDARNKHNCYFKITIGACLPMGYGSGYNAGNFMGLKCYHRALFPGGHASSGFALLVGYFIYRTTRPKRAYFFLLAALILGFAMGWAQMMRGAHFLSHTLWTGWIIWGLNVMAYVLFADRFAKAETVEYI